MITPTRMRTSRLWAEEDVSYLRKGYREGRATREIAFDLDRSHMAVRHKARLLKLKSSKVSMKHSRLFGAYIAYVAGLVDADGSITHNPSLRVVVYNTNGAVMEWLHEHFAGRVYHLKPGPRSKKPYHVWSVAGKHRAVALLQSLLPYLIIKKQVALDALAWVQGDYRTVGRY